VELVVLLDAHGREIGSAPKASVHHDDTPLHLGFSCYIFDAQGRVLLTRRALGKTTWPGVWTNSVCGHPAPGEQIAVAVQRRAKDELGLRVEGPVCVLPGFRYRAVAADGTVENEICPVYCARTNSPVQAASDEVMEWRWVSWSELRRGAELGWPISPWAAKQIPLLETALKASSQRSNGHARTSLHDDDDSRASAALGFPREGPLTRQ
jgi:isopentenyl-diphosphate delta-isomerase